MRYLIASDIHGSAYYCRELMRAVEEERPDRILLLGDLLYHGPRNDLPRDYDPRAVIGMLNPLRRKLVCVRGNCDTEVDQMVLEFPILADYALVEQEGLTVFATHGHHFHRDALPPIGGGEILLHGHTHIPACDIVGEAEDARGARRPIYCLNPGSVSIPKEGSPHSYMTWEGDVFIWKNLEGGEYRRFSPLSGKTSSLCSRV